MTIYENLLKNYGINHKKATNILIYLGINGNTKFQSIPKMKLNTYSKILNHYKQLKNNEAINSNLKKFIRHKINQKIKINSYPGKRHRLNLPVRNQRTSTNGKTAKRKYI